MLLLTALLPAALTSAETPKYCGRWLPAAAGATWPCPGEAVEGVSSGTMYRLRSGVKDDECGPGELLAEGFAQHRALGRALRARPTGRRGPLESSRPII